MPSAPAIATKPHSGWPSHRRLLHRPEFRAAYEQGLRVTSRHFTLFGLTRPLDETGAARFGITVSRKLGKAVVRNRIRRRTREILRRLDPVIGGGGGAWNIVVNPRPSVASADFPRLAQELAEQVRRLGEALNRRPPAPASL